MAASPNTIYRQDLHELFMGTTLLSLSPEMKKSSAYSRFQQMSPAPLCGFDPSPPAADPRASDAADHTSPDDHPSSPLKKPSADDDDTSQDSGVCVDDSVSAFKFPLPPPIRVRQLSHEEEPAYFSPTANTANSPSIGFATMPTTLNFSSPCLHPGSPLLVPSDDGFSEPDNKENVPAAFDGLLHGLMVSPMGSAIDSLPIKRGLFRSPSAPRLSRHRSESFKNRSECGGFVKPAQKRCDRDDDCAVVRPMEKRRRSIVQQSVEPLRPSPRTLQRCQSEMAIKTAMNRADEHQGDDVPLIGDCSKQYCLPLCVSKHEDLRCISHQTLVKLMDGEYTDVVNRYLVVDCRYPYEFDGGHIEGAANLYTKMEVFTKFLRGDDYRNTESSSKRNIIIFHCEFSSERAPRLSRFLRNKDRDENRDDYPKLHYPELYLLEGGYKRFWEQNPEKCTHNKGYKPMLHKDHSNDLRLFRIKSKSWADERSCGVGRVGRSRTALKDRF